MLLYDVCCSTCSFGGDQNLTARWRTSRQESERTAPDDDVKTSDFWASADGTLSGRMPLPAGLLPPSVTTSMEPMAVRNGRAEPLGLRFRKDLDLERSGSMTDSKSFAQVCQIPVHASAVQIATGAGPGGISHGYYPVRTAVYPPTAELLMVNRATGATPSHPLVNSMPPTAGCRATLPVMGTPVRAITSAPIPPRPPGACSLTDAQRSGPIPVKSGAASTPQAVPLSFCSAFTSTTTLTESGAYRQERLHEAQDMVKRLTEVGPIRAATVARVVPTDAPLPASVQAPVLVKNVLNGSGPTDLGLPSDVWAKTQKLQEAQALLKKMLSTSPDAMKENNRPVIARV